MREFVASGEFRQLAAGMTQADAQTVLAESRQDVLATVESDRAAFREAVVEYWESRWRYGKALRGVGVLLGLSLVFLAAFTFAFYAQGQDTAILVVAVVGLIAGIARSPLEDRLTEFGEATAARRHDSADLQAAELLLMRALYEVAFPQWLRQLDQVQELGGSGSDREPPSSVADASATAVAPFDSRHLVEVYRSSEQVSTRARVRLLRLVQGLTGASLGIAGPRGAGKTTLLRWLFDYNSSEFGHLALRVPAPVRYEPRDFVLTVFAQLCEETMRPRGAPLFPGRRRFFASAGAIWLGGGLVFAGVMVNLSDATIPGTTRDFVGVAIALIGVAVLGLRIVATPNTSLSPEYLSGVRIRSANPVAIAPTLLRDIRFQLTYATGYSGKLTAGVGELGADASYSLAARQESFPDVVARFQAFLEAVARQRDRVYIGIDELDKLPVEDAVRFLDDLKGLFGVPQCFFLVSISEDALGHFERRGLPMRDAFDSAFDEVLHVEPLSATESVTLLQRRAEGIHEGLASLCHVLAAGIPRDVIRQARRLAEICEDQPTVAAAASQLVERDFHERMDGLRLAADGGSEVGGLLQSWLAAFSGADDEVLAALGALSSSSSARLGCLVYIGATALQLVARDSNGELTELGEAATALGEARALVATSSELAWSRCNEVRRRSGLAPSPFPVHMDGHGPRFADQR